LIFIEIHVEILLRKLPAAIYIFHPSPKLGSGPTAFQEIIKNLRWKARYPHRSHGRLAWAFDWRWLIFLALRLSISGLKTEKNPDVFSVFS